MADLPTARFFMHGAREAMASGLAHIEEQVKGIEQAAIEIPGLAFDLSKTLIESICRTVLRERAVAFGRGGDVPKHFRSMTRNKSFFSSTASDAPEVLGSIQQRCPSLALLFRASVSCATIAALPRMARIPQALAL